MTQTTALLALVSSFDNRKPNPEMVTAWNMTLSDVRFDDARDAVIDYFQTESKWIMPADVLKRVKRMSVERQAVLATAELPPELEAMEDGPEFNAAYLRWVKTQGRDRLPQKQLTA